MKQNIFYTVVVTLSLMMFYGCSNETGDDPGGNPRGEEKDVQVLFKSATNNDTKADFDTRAEQPATLDEKDFDRSKIMLYVYDENGNLEFQEENITLPPDPDNSYTITITTGTKYFYAFANTGKWTMSITGKQSRGEFERQILNVIIDDDEETPDLAGNGSDRKFFLGTLWGVKTEIEEDKDHVNTDPITLDIGRNTGKVKLHDVLLRKDQNDTYSVLKGELGPDIYYRIGGVPLKSYLVGQYTGKTYPGSESDDYDTVTSAVHTEGPDEENDPDPIFASYKFKPVTALPSGNDPLDNYFYVVENTTAKDSEGKQYFNNTAHIRLKTTYIPDPSEVHDADLKPAADPTLTNGTFWTAIKNDQRYITNEQPNEDPGVVTDIKKYENGVQYHLIPIQNPARKDVETKNAVLRNHYYEINIEGIRDLGYAEDDEGQIIPIPTGQDVKVTIKVKDWSKITHGPKI